MLDIQGLTLGYRGTPVVTDASLHIERGNAAAITGRSGSGKSSLLAAILGMVTPLSGTITVDGTDVASLRGRAHREYLRTKVSMIFQHSELIEELTPIENVTVPALLAGIDKQAATSRAEHLLAHFEVPGDGRPTSVLSGGEKQRLGVARALVTQPVLVLADEPTGSLDAEFRDRVADAILTLPAQWDCALLIVTHDPALAARADTRYELVPTGTGSELRPVR